ncbi:MinD/ParA family ATP-binding protein, partial [Solicola sp. PLA-1-18]
MTQHQMSTEPAPPELYPVVVVTIEDGRVVVDGDLLADSLIAAANGSPHAAAVHVVAVEHAQRLDRPVYALATDSTGRNRLTVHPDGRAYAITPVSDEEADDIIEGAARAARRGTGLFDDGPAMDDGEVAADDSKIKTGWEIPAQRPAPSKPGARRRVGAEPEVLRTTATTEGRRKSFISHEPTIEPARHGWRGALNKLGMKTKPSDAELAFREDVRQVSQHWPGPRTIAIANPKGSANKTPTMVCLSAIFGRYGGAGVLGWDNNETRGTAAWRTRQGPHEATVLELLPYADDLLGSHAQAAHLAHYVHHQPADKFDVLWSDQSTASEHEMTGEEVRQVHEVAAKYYRLIFMDSGNSERASNWRAMITAADQLVVPCTNVEDTAEAGARMLEALAQRDEHSADLARNAVAIVSQRTSGKDPNMARIVADLGPLVRTVVTIPHDPALYSGIINFDALRPDTQRAWLRAGAAVSRG